MPRDDPTPLTIDSAYTPERDAFGYPGPELGFSYLLTPSTAQPIRERPGEPLERSAVRAREPAGGWIALERALAVAGAAPLSERFPVVAFGANRNPHHLVHRFRSVGGEWAMPVLRAALHGAAVVYPAYVGMYGVVTSTLFGATSTVSHVHVVLCDEEQLMALHVAEGCGTRHDFGVLDECMAELENGARLRAPYAYSCRPGVANIEGAPRRLERVAVTSSDVEVAPLSAVIEHVLARARRAGLDLHSFADLQAHALAGGREQLVELLQVDALAHGLAFSALSRDGRRQPVPPTAYGAWKL